MNSLILKTETGFQKVREKYKIFLLEASRRSFWQEHFKNHSFSYDPEKFSWEYWQKIPFFTKEDFLKIGLEKRISDIGIGSPQKPAKGFALRVTSGTTGYAEPVVTIRGTRAPREIPENEWRTIWLYSPYTLALRGALANNACNEQEKTGRYQTFVLDPYKLAEPMRRAVLEFRADNISGFPYALSRFASFFSESDAGAIPQLIKAYVGGDFLSEEEERHICSVFERLSVEVVYGLAEFGGVGKQCQFLTERRGRNAYHPRFGTFIVELINLDTEGIGEIVVSRPAPIDFALIRYRTGDIGRAIQEQCECGKKWTLILEGRKGFDIVKCGGAMIVRQELERVMAILKDDIADWRAEARDVLQGTRVLGALTIRAKQTPEFSKKNVNRASYLAAAISKELYVTPTETLKNLADSRRFMPLKIEFVESFPETPKRIMLKKVM